MKTIVSINALRSLLGDFNNSVWQWGNITNVDIQTAIDNNVTIDLPWNVVHKQNPQPDGEIWKRFHAGRIAYFVKNGFPDEENFSISLGIKGDRLVIYEGRHRLASAIFRGDACVSVRLSGNDEDLKKTLTSIPSPPTL